MLNPTVLDQVAVNQGMSHSKVNHELKQRWQEHKNAHPRMRIRDAAKILEVSELELLVTGCGDSVVRLKPDWPDILKSLQSLGPVMALTRNEYAVHEKNGVYNKVRIMGSMGLVLDKAIDLRLFLSHWHHGFSVCENDMFVIKTNKLIDIIFFIVVTIFFFLIFLKTFLIIEIFWIHL